MNFVGMDKLSLLDYEEKVSCVLFSKACNFRCPFCHNGLTVLESQDQIAWETVMEYLNKRKGVLDAVVFTGGEVTLMPDLKEKMMDVKKLGYLIKLDTNGTNPQIVQELIDLKLIDYVAMDIKNSKAKYPITTNTANVDYYSKVLETYNILKSSGIEYELRTTLVYENHDEEDFKEIAKTFKDAPKFYLQKFVEREGVIKKGLHPIDEGTANKFKSILEEYIPVVNLRGY